MKFTVASLSSSDLAFTLFWLRPATSCKARLYSLYLQPQTGTILVNSSPFIHLTCLNHITSIAQIFSHTTSAPHSILRTIYPGHFAPIQQTLHFHKNQLVSLINRHTNKLTLQASPLIQPLFHTTPFSHPNLHSWPWTSSSLHQRSVTHSHFSVNWLLPYNLTVTTSQLLGKTYNFIDLPSNFNFNLECNLFPSPHQNLAFSLIHSQLISLA